MSYIKRQMESEIECIEVLAEHADKLDCLGHVIFNALVEMSVEPKLTPAQAFGRGFDHMVELATPANDEEDEEQLKLVASAKDRATNPNREQPK